MTVFWLLLACGPTYEDGMVEQGYLYCELLEVCDELATVGYDSVKSCQSAVDTQDFAECPKSAYDAESMAQCLDDWAVAVEEADCDASPEACMPAQLCPQ